MRSPGSAQLVLDEVGTMVNCTVKAEGKKEPCYEDPQGSAAAAESQPGDPARTPQNGADPQAPAQVPSTLLGPLGQGSQPASAAAVHVPIPPVDGTGTHQGLLGQGPQSAPAAPVCVPIPPADGPGTTSLARGRQTGGWVGQATCLSRTWTHSCPQSPDTNCLPLCDRSLPLRTS